MRLRQGTIDLYTMNKPNSKSLFLSSETPLVVTPNTPKPVLLAVQDIARDWQKVTGAPLRIVPTIGDLRGKSGLVLAGPNISMPPGLHNAKIKGLEAHGVFCRTYNNAPVVVLEGADTRGMIYALYSFAEAYLNVPPLWFWASWTPPKQKQITIPFDKEILFGSPVVPHRAWFPNDTDLYAPWKAKNEANYAALFEALLRCKLNTLEGALMDADSWNTRGNIGRESQTARDRGIAITGHHIYPFGARLRDWNAYWTRIERKEVPPLLSANLPALLAFWRYHIECAQQNKMEVVWQIAFRGDGDKPFWETFPDAPASDADRAKIIGDMMRAQIALLKSVTGNPAPLMRTTLYNENSEFLARGLLRLPDEPTLIPNFASARRDHYPTTDVRNFNPPSPRPVGYYFNFQFTSTGAHLAPAEGPSKMERNFRLVHSGNRRLLFSVVNMGNIREFVIEGAANAAFLWNPKAHQTEAFLVAFCSQYFGAALAPAIAGLFQDYYQAFWQQQKPNLPGFPRQYIFQDLRYARALEQIIMALQKGVPNGNPLKDEIVNRGGRYFNLTPRDTDEGAANQLDALLIGTGRAAARFAIVAGTCDVLAPNVPAPGRAFFADNLQVPAHFMRYINETLHYAADALRLLPDKRAASVQLTASVQAISNAQKTLNRAEHGAFTGWYNSDRVWGIKRITNGLVKTQKTLGEVVNSARLWF